MDQTLNVIRCKFIKSPLLVESQRMTFSSPALSRDDCLKCCLSGSSLDAVSRIFTGGWSFCHFLPRLYQISNLPGMKYIFSLNYIF